MSLKNAIFSDSQAKIYFWVFGQPNRSFHLNELRKLTGLGSATLQREVNKLVTTKLATSKTIGNQRHISANQDSPVFNELYALTRKVMGITPTLLDALTLIADKITLALVYGSVAKETDTSTSDIDVMLVGQDLSLREVLEKLTPTEELLGRKVNPSCYTLQEFKKRLQDPESFVSKVLHQQTIQLIGNVDDFRGAQKSR